MIFGKDSRNYATQRGALLLLGAGSHRVRVAEVGRVTTRFHAQAKPKAYIISETEVLDAAALAAYTRKLREVQKAQ
jgi:hypothetical protein